MDFTKLQNLLFEANKTTKGLKPNSDEARKDRASNVEILSLHKYTPRNAPKDKPLLKGWKLYEMEVKSAEQVEGRKHNLYIVLDQNNNVRDVYCSCADFQFLWRAALEDSDLASWETYPEYTDIETHGPHTQEPANVTNPSKQKKLCKHLIKAFDTLNI